jgi:hypothetical protein
MRTWSGRSDDTYSHFMEPGATQDDRLARSQRTGLTGSIAPVWQATSCPLLSSNSVGMLRIPYRAARF